MDDDDPFTMVFNALWSLADSSIMLSSIVKIGNKIKYNKNGAADMTKSEASNADKPELILVPTAATIQMHSTSSTSAAIRQFEWWLSTDSMNVTRSLMPFEFALFTAMLRWKTVLGALKWPLYSTQGFCKRMDVVSVQNGFNDADRNRGLRGWSAIWGCEVEMHFDTDDLIAYTMGELNTGTGS